MSGSYLITDVLVNDVILLDEEIHVDLKGPEGKCNVSIDVGCDEEPLTKKDNGGCVLKSETTVTVTMDDPDKSQVYLRALVRVGIATSCGERDSDEETRLTLLERSLYEAYSFAKSLILAGTRLSPMNGMIIPDVDPKKLLDAVLEARDDSSKQEMKRD